MNTPEKFSETLSAQHRLLLECDFCLEQAEYAINGKVIYVGGSNAQSAKDWIAGAMASALAVYNNLHELYSQQIITKV